MQRRGFLAGLAGGAGMAAMPAVAVPQLGNGSPQPAATLPTGQEDRAYMVALAERMATPILSRMARGRLQREWTPELSPSWDGRDPKVSYMEAFARLIDGIAPWLALADTDDAEGRVRRTLREQVVQSFIHSVDPKSPDRLGWEGHGQALVDSAYFTSALLRAPDALWKPLDPATKRRIVEVIKGLRRVSPPYQNWLLFACMNEAFLFSIGEDWDPMRIDLTIKLFAGDWYLGDGWYGDGASFHFDYYNSYVIHPMMVQIMETIAKGKTTFNNLKPAEEQARALKRMQRFGEHLERMIGPDGAYAAIGRSLTYRIAAHQVLGVLAWRGWLPDTLPPAQVRAATVAAARQVFGPAGGLRNFDDHGFMQIGFTGHQPALGDWYSNAGSMYIASEGLVALGLPAGHPYWSQPGQPWTMRRAYAGMDFRKDYPVGY